MASMADPCIVVAGATGNLGERIVRGLVEQGARVRALVRPGTAPERIQPLEDRGVEVAPVDLTRSAEIAPACEGAACVVSALAGLRDVVLEAQTVLLEGAVEAKVPRFIPSDYSLDFTKLPAGRNRNLDLRREFHQRLAKEPIAATSILNGAFADMLTGQMPMVLFKIRRVLYWGSADQRMDFTTVDDTAAFAARAALDPATPRFLRIAGDELSPRELAAVASEVTGKRFRLLRPGGLRALGLLIRVARTVAPCEGQLYPPWQGMQYLRDMLDGRAKLHPLDNDRYADIRWTPAREVLARAR